MSASQGGYFNAQQFTNLGQLGVGMRLYGYNFGTTQFKQIWQDAAGTISQVYSDDGGPLPDSQYIPMDARGECPVLYLSPGSYSLALKDSLGATVWTRRADPTAATVTNVYNSNQSVVPVTLAPPFNTNAQLSNSFELYPTAPFTLSNPTNLTAGMTILYRIQQPVGGGASCTYGSMFKFPGGVANGALTLTGNAVDIVVFYYCQAQNRLECVRNSAFS